MSLRTAELVEPVESAGTQQREQLETVAQVAAGEPMPTAVSVAQVELQRPVSVAQVATAALLTETLHLALQRVVLVVLVVLQRVVTAVLVVTVALQHHWYREVDLPPSSAAQVVSAVRR